MSIITTVYLKEGIIMAADSRLTGITTYQDGRMDRLTLSDNGQKLFLVKNESIGISACGDAEIDGKTVADFVRIFELEQIKDDDTVKTVAEKLCEYTKGKYAGIVEFHVCGYSSDNKYVYRISKDKLQVFVDEGNCSECGAVWNGEIQVISNLLTGEYAVPIEWNFMQLKDGIDFADFLIDATCKIHRFQTGLGTCGGAIDILLITKDFSKWIRHKVFNP